MRLFALALVTLCFSAFSAPALEMQETPFYAEKVKAGDLPRWQNVARRSR